MLLTTCPNCSAQFKVLTDQLNVRQGRVMCGRCRQVFDAFQSLTRGPDTTGPHVPLDNRESSPHPETTAPKGALEPGVQESDASAIVLEDLEAPESPSTELPTARSPAATPLAGNEPNPLLARAAGARGESPKPRAAGWVALSVLAGMAALGQTAYSFRADLANRWPETRPWLAKACEPFACDLPYGRDDAAMKIEASDLLEQPGKANRIQVTATLANRGRIGMDYPWLELRLTDNANQIVLSKSLRPQDYFGSAPLANAFVPPGTEVFINFVAEIAPKVPASGYSVRAYYP